MSTIGETFTNILLAWEQRVKTGAATQAEYEQRLAAFLPEWKLSDPISFRDSKWYTDFGAAAGYSAPRSFEQLTLREKARALYIRFGGDMRSIQNAIVDLHLPPSDHSALQNDVRFVDQSEAFSPLAKQVMESTTRRLPEGQVFDARTVFDPQLAKALRDPATGKYYGSRREGARQVSDLEASVRAAQGSMITQAGDQLRVAMVKGAKDPSDPANINRELKTLYGQSGFQSKVFLRRAGSETLEPVYAEGISRDAGPGQTFRPDYVQDVTFAVMNRRFKEEGQGFTLGQRHEAVLREFKFLPGILPEQVRQQSILGPRRQIELAPGIVHDTDDYTKTTVQVHSSDSRGTWVMIDRSIPIEGGGRYDAGGAKVMQGGHTTPERLGLPADFMERVPEHLKPQFAADFSTVSKNPSARWYAEVVSEIQRKGRAWLDSHGYGDAYDSASGQIRWEKLLTKDHAFEYTSVEDPSKTLKGGLTRFQVLALDINNDPERFPDIGGVRGEVFLAKEAGSYTRSGAYSWRQPRRNIEALARIAERDPKLYQQMIYESRPRQLMYAEVVNTSALNAGYGGVLSTATEHVRDENNNIIGMKDRVATLTPELAAQIMDHARALAKGGEVGFQHFAQATEHILSRNGLNPTSRLAFNGRADGAEQTFYLTGARANSYFSGPHWQHDMKSLLDEDQVPDALKHMQTVLSRFGRSQMDVVETLSRGQAVSDGQVARLLSSENDLVGGHDFQRGMTGFAAKHSWGGPIIGDAGMAANQIAVPDNVLHEMFPELAAHPEAMNQLKFMIDHNDVVATATREPSPARLQQFYKMRMVTLGSVAGNLTIQDTRRMVVHPTTIGQASGDFDGDGFTTLIRSRIRWNGTTKSFELRGGGLTSSTLSEIADQAKLLEARTWQWTKGPDGLPRKVGLVGMQALSYDEDMAKIQAAGGNLQVLQERQIMAMGNMGSYSMSQMLNGLGWMRQSKESLGTAYNMGRGWRGLSGDDERYADLMAKLDQIYVDAGKESPGLKRFMENMQNFQPATGYVKRGGPGEKAKFTRFSSNSMAAFDTIAAFMQIDELGDNDFVAQLLWPDEADPNKDAKRKTLMEIRESKDWDRLKEVFGDDPWQQAASLSPILGLFRSRASGRWERRLNREHERPQSTTPLKPMGALDDLWAALEHGQSAMVSVNSGKFGGTNHDPGLSEQQRLYATISPMLEKYRAAAGDEGMARIMRDVMDPMLGIMGEQTHRVDELVNEIRAQTSVLFGGARVKAATGGSFMVPPGFNDDDYLIGVKSGEKVTVETPAQMIAKEMRARGRGTQAFSHFAAGTTGTSLPGEEPERFQSDVWASGMGHNLVSALVGLFNKGRDTAETSYGRRVHKTLAGRASDELERARGGDASARYMFGEVGLRGTLGADAEGGQVGASGIADLIQLYQEGGDWKYQLSDYKTGGEHNYEQQLQLYRWMIENGQLNGPQGEVLRKFMDERGLTFGNEAGKSRVSFGGGNLIYQHPRADGAAALSEGDMADELYSSLGANRGGNVDISGIGTKIREQHAVNTQAKSMIGRVRNYFNTQINRGGGSDATNGIAASLTSGSYGRQLGGMESLLGRMLGNPAIIGAGAGGGGGGGARQGGGIFGLGEYNLETSTPAAATFGRGMMNWAQGGELDVNAMLGDMPNTSFRPALMESAIHMASARQGTASRLSWDQMARSSGVMHAFMQQNLDRMPQEVQDYFKGETRDTAGTVSPAGPGYNYLQSLSQASRGTGGGVKLARTATGEWTSDIEAITSDAKPEIKDLVTTFKALVSSGKALNQSLTDLHASTTDVGKGMNTAQGRFEAAASGQLKRMGVMLTTLRNVAEKGELPAAGTEAAEDLSAVTTGAPGAIATAGRMGAAGAPPGGFKGFLMGLFGSGAEGGSSMMSGGIGGRLAQGNQLLTGVQALYMARLDRMLVEPALHDVSLLAQQQTGGAVAMAQMGMPYAATPTMRYAAQYQAGQSRWQQQAGVTWGTALSNISNMGSSYGGAASILGPALGVGAMGAYVAGQALQGAGATTLAGLLPEAAAVPLALPAALALGGGLAAVMVGAGLSSRQAGLVADPAQAQMLALQALPSRITHPAAGAPIGAGGSVGAGLMSAMPEALARGWGATINYGMAHPVEWGASFNAVGAGVQAVQQIVPQAEQAAGLLGKIRGGMTRAQWQQLSPTERQTALSMQVYGMPGEGYQGLMGQYGVGADVATQASVDAANFGIAMPQAIAGAAAGINAGQNAAAWQGQYGGTLEKAAVSAAQFNGDPFFQQQAVQGFGTPLNRSLQAAGISLSPQEAARTNQVNPSVANRAADLIQQAYSIQQQSHLAGASTSGIDRMLAGSLKRLATDPSITPAQANAILSDAQSQIYGAQQAPAATMGAAGFLQNQGRMSGVQALATAQQWSQDYGGNLATGAGAGFMQMAQGFMSGNANVVSQVGGIVGGNTMFTTGAGRNVTGFDMINRQMGGVSGFAGMQLGQSSVFLQNGMVAPIFQGAVATGHGVAGQALTGGYVPLGVRQGNMAASMQVGGQTYTWGQNIGGLMGLQAAASDASYQASMASAGLTYQNIARERAFQTGNGVQNYPNYYATGTPLPWAQGSTNATAQPFQAGQGMWYWQDQQTAQQRQQQQYGFQYQQQQFSLQASQFGASQGLQSSQFADTQAFNRAQSTLSYTRGVQDLSLNRTVQMQQRQYQTQDFAYERSNETRNYGWQQEDIDFNLRFATGRDRVLLERQKKRSTITHDTEEGHIDTLEARQKTQWKNEDQRYGIDVSRNAQDFKIRTEQYDLESKHFNESLALTKKQFEESQALQMANAERQKQFTTEQWAYEDKLTQLQRAYWDENLKAQATAAGISAGAAATQKAIADKQMEIEIAMQAQNSQIGQWYDTEYGMMTTWIDHMRAIEAALRSGNLDQLGISPGSSPSHNSQNIPDWMMPHAAGYSGLIGHRALMSVAEQGPEYVSVMPFGRPGFGYAPSTGRGDQGGGPATGGNTQILVYIDGQQVSARVERRLAQQLTGDLRR